MSSVPRPRLGSGPPGGKPKLAVAGGLLVAFLVFAPSAGAHAFLLSTSPALGARLGQAPKQIALNFSEAVTLAQGGIELKRIGGGSAPIVGKPRVVNGGRTIALSLGPLRPGVYDASWQIIADDGHFEAGELDFQVGNVGQLPTSVSGTQTPLPWPLVLARLVIYIGLALSFGRALVALRLGARHSALTTLGALAVLAGGLLQQVALAAETSGGPIWRGLTVSRLDASSATQAGKLSLAIIAVAAVQLLTLRLWRDRSAPLIGCGALVIAALALSGHSAHTRLTPLSVALDAVHIAAATVWLGGLAELASIAFSSRDQLSAKARRFAVYGFGATALLAATGIYAAVIHVEHVGNLTGTPYGRAVLAKSGLFIAALAFGGYNHLTTRGGRSRARSIVFEPAVIAMIVAVASILVNVAPPATNALAAGAPPALAAAAPLKHAKLNLAQAAGPP